MSEKPDRILISQRARGKQWWDACKGCALEGDPLKCVEFNAALETLRGYGCTTRERWIRPA